MEFSGATGMRITEADDLVFEAGGTEVSYRRPMAFQLRGGKRVPVEVRYRFNAAGRVGFGLGEYDESLPLTIDPVLSFSTILPDSRSTYQFRLAVDAAGAIYVARDGNPSTVMKLDPVTRKPVYQNYSSSYTWNGIAADSSGQAYVTGGSGAQAFVSKLDATGNPVFTKYVGDTAGSRTVGWAIAVDSSGAIYVTGSTTATDFPLTNAYQTTPSGTGGGFLVKLESTGSTILSTYLPAAPSSIAVDPSGNVYLAGQTNSPNLPLANAIQGPGNVSQSNSPAFVMKFDSSVSTLLYSTYLGTNGYTVGGTSAGIAADAAGNAYIAGNTTDPFFPLLNPVMQASGCYLMKLSSVGGLIFSTFFGGRQQSSCSGLALTANGRIAIAGDILSGSYLPLA
jgi:hypothetical protein